MAKFVEGKTARRSLDQMDRAMAIKAAEKYYGGEKRNDWKGMVKLEKIRKALDIELLADQQEAQQDDLRERHTKWVKAEEEVPGSGGKRPSLKVDDMRGEKAEYILALGIDSAIREALKTMEWEAPLSPYVQSVTEAFGLEFEETDFDLPKEAQE